MRTVPNISPLLKPLDDEIDIFIKTLLNDHQFSKEERLLYSLPPKFGGLGIIVPSKISDQEHQNSRAITNNMVTRVIIKDQILSDDQNHTNQVKNKIKNEKKKKKCHNYGRIKIKNDE